MFYQYYDMVPTENIVHGFTRRDLASTIQDHENKAKSLRSHYIKLKYSIILFKNSEIILTATWIPSSWFFNNSVPDNKSVEDIRTMRNSHFNFLNKKNYYCT